MRAALVREFGGNDRIQIEQVQVPQPNDNQASSLICFWFAFLFQVLVRVKAAGVNPGECFESIMAPFGLITIPFDLIITTLLKLQ